MNDTTALATRPLIVEPLEPQPDVDRWLRLMADEPPTERDETTTSIHGHCADFCVGDVHGDTDGVTIEDHGRFCESRSLLWAEGTRIDGTALTLYGSIVKPYQHGVYDRAEMPLPAPSLLAVRSSQGELDDYDEDFARSVFFGAGELRRMAATFIRAADVIDGLEQPLNRR